jgi:hypothetical protein
VLPEIHIERRRVPVVLLQPCGNPWHKAGRPANAPAGGAEIVEDLYTRGDVNEQRLQCANAKLKGVGDWDKQ